MDSVGGGDDFYISDHDDDGDNEIDMPPQKRYKTVQEDEIRQLQQNYISDVSNFISVSRSVACTLLCQNHWIPSSVCENWFSSENPHPVIIQQDPSSAKVCHICFETDKNMLPASSCGHLFCSDCWKSYISVSIQEGPGCLTLKCPEPGCESNPGLDMVESLASADDKDKYYRYLFRSYIESNTKKRKWCPAPGCAFAIELDENDGGSSSGDHSYEATCKCGYKMCFDCGEERHNPSGCEMVRKWIEKNSSEAENTAWILAYTKPCPKCRKSIEKNQGCNHMTCPKPCGSHFCWICLRDIGIHDYNNCNRYTEESCDATADGKSRANAKKRLERYTHYYERWDANDKSRKRALADLKTARDEHVDRLADTQRATQGELKCVVEAWEQIVECRRVLKWSYAFGYYLSESGSGKFDFFGLLLGDAENALERLHFCAEKEMDKFLSGECASQDFRAFRTNLTDLTLVTKKYFENLVKAWENDFCGADIVEESSRKRKKIC